MKKQNLTINNFGSYFLLFCVVGLLILLYGILKPFILDLVLAAILSSVFYPLYKLVLKLTRDRKRLSSFLTCTFIVFVILIPLSLFTYQFILEAIEASKKAYTQIQSGALDPILEWRSNGIFSWIREKLLPFVDIKTVDLTQFDLTNKAGELATNTASKLSEEIKNIATRIILIFFHFGIMIISMFFFFKDAPKIINTIKHLSPLPTTHNETIFEKFREISQATMFGIFFTAIIQGMLGAIGFAIAGLPNPIFWGALMILFALIPFLGTPVVWGPAFLYLLFTKQFGQAIFLFIWGAALVGTIDNFLRPYFIHGKSRTTDPLLMFLAILGGLWTQGIIGIIIGPLILTLAVVFIQIYEIEYHGVLHHKDKNHKENKSLVKKIFKKIRQKKT